MPLRACCGLWLWPIAAYCGILWLIAAYRVEAQGAGDSAGGAEPLRSAPSGPGPPAHRQHEAAKSRSNKPK